MTDPLDHLRRRHEQAVRALAVAEARYRGPSVRTTSFASTPATADSRTPATQTRTGPQRLSPTP